MKLTFIIGGACQGKTEYAKENFGDAVIIDDYQDRVRQELESGKNPQTEVVAFLDELKDRDEDVVVIAREMGDGIVPMDAFMRRYREENGRVNCIIASNADRVLRMFCGIASEIK